VSSIFLFYDREQIKEVYMSTTLGEKIRKHRKEKGYSLDKLAELSESSKSYLWELENRETRKPSAEKITSIAQALGVTTDYLLDENATPDEAVLREAFFRDFTCLTPDDQERIRDIVATWGAKK
jgi:transcriptional regulator with XRE-family HTH domain